MMTQFRQIVGRSTLRPYGITIGIVCLVGLFVALVPALAQDASEPIEDQVRDIAEHMYCPICENEPLDECRNQTCVQWKDEIQRQLEEGQTEDEIVNYFVERYGDKVIGVPQDPTLRFLSFIMPIIGTILAIGMGLWTFQRWSKQDSTKTKATPSPDTYTDDDSNYRNQLERDLM